MQWNNYPDFKHVTSGETLWIRSCPLPLRSKLNRLQDAPLDQRACRAAYKVSPLEVRTGHTVQPEVVQQTAQVISGTVLALKSCRNLERGREIHTKAANRGVDKDLYVANSLIAMYTRCHSLVEARAIFDRLVNRDVISWNALLMGYVLNGKSDVALELFESMTVKPNRRTWIPVLMACADMASKSAGSDFASVEQVLHMGTGVHKRVAREGSNIYLDNTLVDMYCKCGRPDEARKVFDGMETRNIVSWNAMIHGYVWNGENMLALELFERTDSPPNERTYVGALVACANLAAEGDRASKERLFQLGGRIHSQAEKNKYSDHYVRSSLINMYSKCGKLVEARKVFDSISRPCTVSWNMILQAYVENGEPDSCLRLFNDMQTPQGCVLNAGSFVQALQACADLAAKDRKLYFKLGKEIHALARNNNCLTDSYVEGTLVDMYVKCGSLEDARAVLDGMRNRTNVAAWNAMLWGYVNAGRHETAVSLFRQMKTGGCVPDWMTYMAVFTSFGEVMALKAGEELHKVIRREGLEKNTRLATCLLEFYGKCGNMDLAEEVFQSMAMKDVDLVAWNALMAGYTQQGRTDEAFQVLHRMVEQSSQPNHVTFLLLLSVCSQAGLIHKGKALFKEMLSRYNLSPSREHYTCLVDMLGRAGHLQEALELVWSMPLEPDAAVWRTLLSSCRRWKNVTLGRYAFESLLKISKGCRDEVSAVAYVHMANIYGCSGMVKDQAEVLAARKKLKVVKEPSTTWWTDDQGTVHKFLVGEQQSVETENRLKELLGEIKEHGYVVDVRDVCGDVAEEERVRSVCSHSEKLAIAYAFANTCPGTTIRISNSLRLCEDCHNVSALVSKFKQRKIICRDASLLHIFEHGSCSCSNSW